MKISSPSTGITLEVATTSPGLQFYSGGLLSVDAPVTGKGGTQYPRFGGFAVETQVITAFLDCTLCLSVDGALEALQDKDFMVDWQAIVPCLTRMHPCRIL